MKKIFKAFTVLELIIVVVIIGILSAVVYIGYGGIQAQARDASVLSDLDTLDGLMTNYALENNVAGKAVYLEGGVTDTDLDFTPSEGNIIDVVIDDTDYCIRGYNTDGTKNSAFNAFTKESSENFCNYILPSQQALTNPNYTGPKLFLAVNSGGYNTCAIASDNQVYCWGNNSNGQIGDGTSGTNRLVPTAVDTTGALAGKTIKAIAVGYYHTCAIASDNQAYCWGSNSYGQIGDGTSGTNRLVPTAVDTTGALADKTIKAISASSSNTCAIASDNQVYCWGNNSNGQIGDGTSGTNRLVPTAVDTTGALAGKTIKAVSLGYHYACAIASDNQVYCWGYGYYGQLGDGTKIVSRLIPYPVDTTGALAGKTIRAISSGSHNTCAIASDNQAYCFGSNSHGEVGDGTIIERLIPTAVDITGVLASKTIKIIDTTYQHTCAIASDNQAYCWGINGDGGLGDGTEDSVLEPTLTPVAVVNDGLLAGRDIRSINTGSGHTCAITSDYRAYCWGDNNAGQIGDGTYAISRLVPTAVSPLP